MSGSVIFQIIQVGPMNNNLNTHFIRNLTHIAKQLVFTVVATVHRIADNSFITKDTGFKPDVVHSLGCCYLICLDLFPGGKKRWIVCDSHSIVSQGGFCGRQHKGGVNTAWKCHQNSLVGFHTITKRCILLPELLVSGSWFFHESPSK